MEREKEIDREGSSIITHSREVIRRAGGEQAEKGVNGQHSCLQQQKIWFADRCRCVASISPLPPGAATETAVASLARRRAGSSAPTPRVRHALGTSRPRRIRSAPVSWIHSPLCRRDIPRAPGPECGWSAISTTSSSSPFPLALSTPSPGAIYRVVALT
jgi:hypothetical protein